MHKSNKIIFLDRDGTLIRDKGYIRDPTQVEIIPSAVPALQRLKKVGYRFVIVSNQSGVARGLYTLKDLSRVNQHIRYLFRKHHVTFEAIYCCPHHPEGIIKQYRKVCSCRKPASGLLRRAARELQINLKHAIIIGDSLRDLEAGKKVGAQTILVLTGKGLKNWQEQQKTARRFIDHITPNLRTAADWILKKEFMKVAKSDVV